MGSKARIDLRLDESVHKRLKKLAADSGLSLNQLLQGVAYWAAMHGHAGLPEFDENEELVTSADEPGTAWFGDSGYSAEDDTFHGGGWIAFVLDYTARTAVREADEFRREY